MIFSGTVRHNLDPVGRVTADADLWAAVRSAGLYDALQSLQVRVLLGSVQTPDLDCDRCLFTVLNWQHLSSTER